MAITHIFGITGAFGSGKSTAAEHIKSAGFQSISLGEILEDELRASGEETITRKKLQDLGNEWRKEYGNAVLVEKALERATFNNWDKIVIEGFRNYAEIKRVRQEGRVIILASVVNRDIRFERLKNLKRREALTRELFDSLDNRDLGVGEASSGLQTALCIAMADIFIDNNGTVAQLKEKIDTIIKTYE